MGLAASLEQERAARMAASGDVAAAEAAARSAQAERDARARDLHAVRAALHDTSEKLAAASAERDMHCARVSALMCCKSLNGVGEPHDLRDELVGKDCPATSSGQCHLQGNLSIGPVNFLIVD